MTDNIILTPDQELILTPEERQKADTYKKQIDLGSTNMVIQYGVQAQNRLTTFSEQVLRQVQAKDMGEVGDMLSGLTTSLRSFDSKLRSKGIFRFFDTVKRKINRIRAEYSSVVKNISVISTQLEKHYQVMMKDINMFDHLYKDNSDYFREISLYIIAGEEKIKEVRDQVLPQLQTEALQAQNQQKAQEYHDLEQQLNRFEKKIHDLKLSRMISLQLAPQIRMVQNNSVLLMDKIQSTISNTLPLWKNQMVLALGLAHSQQALEAQKNVTDATNTLLQRNSEMLRQSTVEIARENERGIVDLETIQKANSDLFATLDDLNRIQLEGREKRIAAEAELKNAEAELKSRLLSIRQDAY